MDPSRCWRTLLLGLWFLINLHTRVLGQRENEAVGNALTAVDIIELGDADNDMIVGVAGTDYPTYAQVPDTSFSCNTQEYPGYYADTEAECQVFHICANEGRRIKKYSFLCPNGTIFDQMYFVCVWWYNSDCSTATSFYSLNANLFDEDAQAVAPGIGQGNLGGQGRPALLTQGAFRPPGSTLGQGGIGAGLSGQPGLGQTGLGQGGV
ncbi:unnamed protein product, partial [Meganyctiphanes norvegica]